jgi:hypothetical protein
MLLKPSIKASMCWWTLFIPLTLRADEHPYAQVRVGDYATYSVRTKVAGLSIDGVTTQTVIAKTDKEVTVKLTGKIVFMGNQQVIPPREQRIDLSKPFDPTKFSGQFPQGAEVQVQKIQEGREKISIGDKSYNCTWIEYQVQAKTPGVNLNSVVKVWMSKDVPMGMVKMIMKVSQKDQNMETIVELKESGNTQ